MRNVCVWCRREGQGSGPEEAGAIVGLCEDHIRRFNAEVEAALRADAARGLETRSLPPGRARRRSARRVTAGLVEHVADVLARNARTDLCDACVAADVGCSVAEAAEAASYLAASPDFLRDQWRCGRCASRQMVTRARSRLLRSRSATPNSAA